MYQLKKYKKYNRLFSNATLKKWVFRFTLNCSRLSHLRIPSGSAFQIYGAYTGKARSPTVLRCADFTLRSFWLSERRDRVGAYQVSIETKYCGASLFKHLKVSNPILYLILKIIGSQCNCLLEKGCNVLILIFPGHYMSCIVLNQLQFPNEIVWNTTQQAIWIV